MDVPVVQNDVDPAEAARQEAVYRPLGDAVRELLDAAIRTTVDDATIREAESAIRAVTRQLRTEQLPGSFGIHYTTEGTGMPWGNAAVGIRNAAAPPLEICSDADDGRHWTDCDLGAAYEGPPGCVHGGVCALILDHLAGVAAGADGIPKMTGTLTVRYLRLTPLGRLRAEAHIDRVEGVKTFVTATVSDAAGPTVEAEGIFIAPAWAR